MHKLYRHYKNKPYKYLGEAIHSESLEQVVVYETRYENDLSSLWVRPKEMFHEVIEVAGQKRPRFMPAEIEFHHKEELTTQDKQPVYELLQQAFTEFDLETLDQKLKDQNQILFTGAYEHGQLVGFKLGYEIDNDTFYSWLGAVAEGYQGVGIAKALIKNQHRWCLEKGYKTIETKTMNRWKHMLILNIKMGFEIIGTETNKKRELKILMRKSLTSSR